MPETYIYGRFYQEYQTQKELNPTTNTKDIFERIKNDQNLMETANTKEFNKISKELLI